MFEAGQESNRAIHIALSKLFDCVVIMHLLQVGGTGSPESRKGLLKWILRKEGWSTIERGWGKKEKATSLNYFLPLLPGLLTAKRKTRRMTPIAGVRWEKK